MGSLKGPVLAIEAVEVAGFEENGQIIETDFRTAIVGEEGITCACAACADPVGNAVCRERIVVKGYQGA